jgi:hypothetical protein
MIQAMTCSLVLTSGAGTSFFGTDGVDDLSDVAARQRFELAS